VSDGVLPFGTFLIIILLMELDPPKTLLRPPLEQERRSAAIRTHILSGGGKPLKVPLPKELEPVSNRQEIASLHPSSVSDAADRMHKSVRVNRELKGDRPSIANSQLLDKIQQIRSKCMRDRGSRISIGKNTAESKEDEQE
jgi:hypothetical protein